LLQILDIICNNDAGTHGIQNFLLES
jgi:hypothetical protein